MAMGMLQCDEQEVWRADGKNTSSSPLIHHVHMLDPGSSLRVAQKDHGICVMNLPGSGTTFSVPSLLSLEKEVEDVATTVSSSVGSRIIDPFTA
jgi:hypothetical protein